MFIVEIYDDSVDDKHPIALIPIPSHHWLSPNRAGSAKLNNVQVLWKILTIHAPALHHLKGAGVRNFKHLVDFHHDLLCYDIANLALLELDDFVGS